MDGARIDRIDDLFLRARELRDQERAEFLSRECADDEMWAEVQRLLDAVR